mgnify:CR=1 FL=1
MKRKNLKEYANTSGNGPPSPTTPNLDQFYKVKSSIATFPYIQIDDIDDVDIVNVEELNRNKDEESEAFPYPFENFENPEAFEKSVEINPMSGGPGMSILKTPSKAKGGKSNQTMPPGMNSPGWASAPRNGIKAKSENDYIKDFLLRIDI